MQFGRLNTVADLIQSQPQLKPDEAKNILAEFYGLQGNLTELDSERDQNFLVTTDRQEKHVLRIANSQTDKADLDLENQAMLHFQKTELAAFIPCPLSSVAGHTIEFYQSRFPVRLVSFIEGEVLAKIRPQSPALLYDFGQKLGMLAAGLLHFEHPAARREFHWDLDRFSNTFEQQRSYLDDASLLEPFVENHKSRVLPRLDSLRKSVIHNDANDYNVIVTKSDEWPQNVTGIIDFGDMVWSSTVNELAIAIAYVMLEKTDPLFAASHVVKGFNESLPLTEAEFDILFDLACARLCTSVVMAAYQRKLNPANEYLSVTDGPARKTLAKLNDISPDFAAAFFRSKCGLDAFPRAHRLASWIDHQSDQFHPILDQPLSAENLHTFDLSVKSSDPIAGDLGAETPDSVFETIDQNKKQFGLGRYLEPRICYQGDQFAESTDMEEEPRTIHMGIDLFAHEGTPIYAPWEGKVHSFADNAFPFDYGPTLILEHVTDHGDTYFTLYGHLSRESLHELSAGKFFKRGEVLATIGSREVNGGWAPHLHFQIMSETIGLAGNFPGVAKARDLELWKQIILNPCQIAGVPEELGITPVTSVKELRSRRSDSLNPSLSLSYQEPLHIVRGRRQHLFDANGLRYLDGVNNVCHVGHCHPQVAEAAANQLALLNTNTRYLHEELVRYSERLVSTLPDGLDVCFLVNSGSEANDLALRLARNFTQKHEVICVDGGYHGNLTSLIEVSPYKFKSPGGKGKPDHIHMVPAPDPLRGLHVDKSIPTDQVGRFYAQFAADALADSEKTGGQQHNIAAFLCESILSCGGQVVLPDDYLRQNYSVLRGQGVLCIADEVQVGFGRVGKHFWGFELQNVVPDIVTMGKPIGNGFPLGAVVTTREIADAFNNGMEYFNTFGGNPVSASVGNAVLDVIENENLQQHADEVGKYFLAQLEELRHDYAFVGDVRGQGLFIGIEFVQPPFEYVPNNQLAKYIVERLRSMRVLLSTDGPFNNVIKIKPPMVFDKSDVDLVIRGLRTVCEDDFPRSFLQ